MAGGRARNGQRVAPLAPNAHSRDKLKSGGAKTSAGGQRRGAANSLVGSVNLGKSNANES